MSQQPHRNKSKCCDLFHNAMIAGNPMDWPNRPFLSMVRKKGKKIQHGFMVDAPGLGEIVFIGRFSRFNNEFNSSIEQLLDECEKRVYRFFTDLLQDGWEVNTDSS